MIQNLLIRLPVSGGQFLGVISLSPCCTLFDTLSTKFLMVRAAETGCQFACPHVGHLLEIVPFSMMGHSARACPLSGMWSSMTGQVGPLHVKRVSFGSMRFSTAGDFRGPVSVLFPWASAADNRASSGPALVTRGTPAHDFDL